MLFLPSDKVSTFDKSILYNNRFTFLTTKYFWNLFSDEFYVPFRIIDQDEVKNRLMIFSSMDIKNNVHFLHGNAFINGIKMLVVLLRNDLHCSNGNNCLAHQDRERQCGSMFVCLTLFSVSISLGLKKPDGKLMFHDFCKEVDKPSVNNTDHFFVKLNLR